MHLSVVHNQTRAARARHLVQPPATTENLLAALEVEEHVDKLMQPPRIFSKSIEARRGSSAPTLSPRERRPTSENTCARLQRRMISFNVIIQGALALHLVLGDRNDKFNGRSGSQMIDDTLKYYYYYYY